MFVVQHKYIGKSDLVQLFAGKVCDEKTRVRWKRVEKKDEGWKRRWREKQDIPRRVFKRKIYGGCLSNTIPHSRNTLGHLRDCETSMFANYVVPWKVHILLETQHRSISFYTNKIVSTEIYRRCCRKTIIRNQNLHARLKSSVKTLCLLNHESRDVAL